MTKYYKNPNGYLTLEEMVNMKKENKIDEYISKFNTIKDKCPHERLVHKDEIKQCFYCVACQKAAFAEIKEYKNHYKVLDKKYEK